MLLWYCPLAEFVVVDYIAGSVMFFVFCFVCLPSVSSDCLLGFLLRLISIKTFYLMLVA